MEERRAPCPFSFFEGAGGSLLPFSGAAFPTRFLEAVLLATTQKGKGAKASDEEAPPPKGT